ncbi:MAG: TonB-dependent receptor [Gammaproteobacteria bacterium]|nr:TonB-dependent receptor [Gammaproteobacteria bacterium]
MNGIFPQPSIRIFLILVAMITTGEVVAQEAAGDDSTIVYPATYFTEYAPITAQDMVDRIPGVGRVGGGGRSPGGGNRSAARGGRGLGGGGGDQILVDGKRTAGKSNETSSRLDRISADQVDYIEIIRGTSGDLDVRGSQIINVVTSENLSSSSFSYEINMDRHIDHETQPGGSFDYAGQTGDLNFLLSLIAEPRYDHKLSKETSVLGDFSANDEVREDRIRDQTNYQLSTNLDYQISDNSRAQFNALYAQKDNPTNIYRWTTDLTGGDRAVSREREDIPGEQDNWEIGGDYEYKRDNGDRFKILFIANENNEASTRERFELLDDGTENKELFLDRSSVLKERIVRSSYTMNLFQNQGIEMGIERAQTTLDSELRLGQDLTEGTPSPDFGGLIPVSVSNANSSVEEIRYEPFVVHNWQFNRRMSLESALIWETSEIIQTGDLSNKQDFDFWKPKLDYRFDVTPMFQLRASVERTVRQLTFSDFVADSDTDDNDSDTQAGNAQLSPESYWKYDIKTEYRLPNDVGVIGAGLWYHEHSDVIDRLDVSTSEDDLRSANGNIGDGDMYGLSTNFSIRMGMINLPNVLVTGRLGVMTSKVKDPFLGIDRRFRNFERGRFNVGFRHDVPRLNMNYGLSWNNRFDGNMRRYDIDDIELRGGDPKVDGFVEFIAFGGTRFRFDARFATNNLQCRERQRFVGRINSGILEEIEDQCEGSGRLLSLKINGTF